MGNETKKEGKEASDSQNNGRLRQFKVLYSDLSQDQEQTSIASVNEGLDKYTTEKDVANHLKNKFDAKYEVRHYCCAAL